MNRFAAATARRDWGYKADGQETPSARTNHAKLNPYPDKGCPNQLKKIQFPSMIQIHSVTATILNPPLP